jgi:chemotaxis protein methyltransferase CheR
MLLTMLLPDVQDWNITLLATDINRHFLRKAAEGTFGEWSFRDAPTFVKETFFTRIGRGRYQILPALQDMVTFAPLNLAEDIYPALLNNTTLMDLVLCRNVLIYLGANQAQSVVQRIGRCLREGGWLLVAPTEVSNVCCAEVEGVAFEGAKAFRKKWMVAAETPVLTTPARVIHEASTAAPASQPIEVPPAESPRAVSSVTAKPPDPAPSAAGEHPADLEDISRLLRVGNARRVVELLTSRAGIDAFPPEPGPDVPPEEAALLARALANLGNLAHAMLWCDRAIAAEKMNPRLHYLRAMILHELGEGVAGADALRRTIYLDHTFVMAHVALADLSRRLGRTDESSRHFRNATHLLRTRRQDEIVPESDGLTVARLVELIDSISLKGGIS